LRVHREYRIIPPPPQISPPGSTRIAEGEPLMFDIDDNVSLPPRHNSYSKYPFGKMEIGQSFALPIATGLRAREAAIMYGKRHGVKFTSRTLTEGGEKVVRIWRVE
jgi:hypothetical protein